MRRGAVSLRTGAESDTHEPVPRAKLHHDSDLSDLGEDRTPDLQIENLASFQLDHEAMD